MNTLPDEIEQQGRVTHYSPRDWHAIHIPCGWHIISPFVQPQTMLGCLTLKPELER